MSTQKLYPLIKDGLYGLQDATGHTILSPMYDYIQISDDERLHYRHQGYWGLLDRQGKVIVSHTRKYEDVGVGSYGFYSVTKKDKVGLIDSNGQLIIPFSWDEDCLVDYTKEGFTQPLIIVSRHEKYGAINLKGKIIIPLIYSDLYAFGDGLLYATLNDKSGAIDENGNTVIPFEYDDTGYFHIDNGLIPVAKDGLYGCINRKNEVVIPFKYYEIYFCGAGLMEVALTPDKKQWNCMDRNGKLLLDQPCKSIDYSEGKKDVLDAIILCTAKRGKQFHALTLNGIQDLPSDGQAVYSADGKVILKLLKNKSKVTIKPGVEHICLVDWLSQSEKNTIREIIFLPDVTRIGKGWGELCYSHDANNPDLDIYLPASVNEIDPEAFTYVMPYLHAIYAHKDSLNHIMRVVPPYLTSYVKKEPEWWQRLLGQLKHIHNPIGWHSERFPILGVIVKVIIVLIMFLFSLYFGREGYIEYEDTMFSFHIPVLVIILGVFGLAALGTLCTNGFKWRKLFKEDINDEEYSKGIMSECFNTWFLSLFVLTNMTFFILFHGNAHGGGEPQQIQAQIAKVETHNGKHRKYKTINTEFDIPPYHMSTDVSIKRSYEAGQKCILFYHEGQFGWNVIDSIKPLY
ncbi:MAG: WG repeat-containing protein [Bacteroidales bacterium]|nr:WG repeat-containing protein [Bacteroidales bacterium]